jgi:hypothetical protein
MRHRIATRSFRGTLAAALFLVALVAVGLPTPSFAAAGQRVAWQLRPRVGLYGGSFNPPGLNHREVAKHIRLFFDQVLVLPCGPRPNKVTTNSVDPRHRANMVELTFGGIEGLRVDFSDLQGGSTRPPGSCSKNMKASASCGTSLGRTW